MLSGAPPVLSVPGWHHFMLAPRWPGVEAMPRMLMHAAKGPTANASALHILCCSSSSCLQRQTSLTKSTEGSSAHGIRHLNAVQRQCTKPTAGLRAIRPLLTDSADGGFNYRQISGL